MLTVYCPTHQQHRPSAELSEGRLAASFELPERARTVLERVRKVDLGRVLAPRSFGAAPLLRVHTAPYLAFLERAWRDWSQDGRRHDALPSTWPARGMRHDRVPDGAEAQLGFYASDCGAPITAGTWAAACASANVALTAQQLISGGERAAFALCRPPGHHAGADLMGGYCYLNNAAVAAQAFIDGGARRVAILDIDYHHGNGTQSIFYARSDVYFTSIHCDPREDYPHYVGHADETGTAEGLGFNLNCPLPTGSGWLAWSAALDQAAAGLLRADPEVLVVSLGVDTFRHDPIASFKLDSADYVTIGRRIAALARPTLFVLEGGYAVKEMGVNVVNVLQGFEAGAGRGRA
jgi:acetoin utilization deacetylase AcuC-like enzyme